MFCPRCGRPVNDGANFCGGCGLPRAEIEKSIKEKEQQMATPVITPAQVPSLNIDDLHSEIEKLEKDLSGTVPVTDYTTEPGDDTNIITPSDFLKEEINAEKEQPSFTQSEYSANAPKNPLYEERKTSYNRTVAPLADMPKDENLSTVDFIWMMLISSLPVIGFIYLIWLGFVQKDNTNKASYAKAVLIISLFSILLAMIFAMGIVISQIAMF